MKRAHSLLTAMSVLLAGSAASAADVVAPNAYGATSGYEYQLSIFGNGSTNNVSYQEGFDASQFAGVPIGATITGIGYRLASNLPTVADDVQYTDLTIRIGSSAVPIASIGTDATANMGADTITARTGAYTLAGGSLVNNGGLNPFYTIQFDTPFVYEGGDLLITTSYTVTGDVPFIGVDAIDPLGVVNTLGGNDPAFLHTHLYNAPVVQFTFAAGPVPETASWLLMVGGFGLVGGALRRQQHGQSVAA